ncbi:PucR family transcriptional regulator [Saccharopolyspora dendranthemae]|uniref:DNA-binding PucR family transcriptional regulator n=1 Tax=Saccharopolyspora dendranthemae TaxID=1181886 RepID=A0A561V7U5_9PSEU|nr:PucR family transcriptional regulator [Saccharopolyspora dendranthemae]TWG07682.1 DNA-binding PucR family transcriptional regulator [Saccharopolyspora dendranthemae]
MIENPALDIRVVPDSLRPGAQELPVRWAHVSERRDPTPYLLGGELLLTSGVDLPETAQEVDAYVRELRDARITALAFGISPPRHDRLPEALRDACVRHGVPLLVIGANTPFLAVNQAVAVELIEAEQREQRYIDDARQALTRAASTGLTELARAVATWLRGWIVLLGAAGERTAEHGAPRVLPAQLDELVAKVSGGVGIRTAATELDDGTYIVAQPVYTQASTARVLVVARSDRFGDTDRAILAIGAALFGLTTRAGTDSAMLGGATTALLLGETIEDGSLRTLLGTGQCRVVAATAHGKGPVDAAAGYDWVSATLGTPLVRLGGEPDMHAIVRTLPRDETLATLRDHGWLAVVSSPRPADRLADCVLELRSLRERARRLGTPLVADRAELSLSGIIEPGRAADFSTHVLAPLWELDAARPSNHVVETLRVWLANHGSWERTASTMDVHRNSVRHRIRQIERALDSDLDDPEIRMQLWFALRWHP